MKPSKDEQSPIAGSLVLPVRLVAAWLFLAAVWRRLVLAPEKHDMESAAWLGHKINTFFPHSTWPFRDLLDWFLRKPEALNGFLWAFTASEWIVGLLLLLGLATRFAGLALFGMSLGLMHTSGWLGPTCLSEWQTASLLVAAGLVVAFGGGGVFSLDHVIARRCPNLGERSWWRLVAGPVPKNRPERRDLVALSVALLALAYVMGMNQVHHGGLWGPLHNYSKVPDIQVSAPQIDGNGKAVGFTVFRDKGPEAWGTHVLEIRIEDERGRRIHRFGPQSLSALSPERIENVYPNEVATAEFGLVLPLGAKARLNLPLPEGVRLEPETDYRVVLVEAGGKRFFGNDDDSVKATAK